MTGKIELKIIFIYLNIIIFLCSSSFSCILLNELDVSPLHVRGIEAKDIIRNKLRINLFISLVIAQNNNSSAKPIIDSASLLIYTVPDELGIKESHFYKKRSVVDCANKLSKIPFKDFAIVLDKICNLQEADPIIDL